MLVWFTPVWRMMTLNGMCSSHKEIRLCFWCFSPFLSWTLLLFEKQQLEDSFMFNSVFHGRKKRIWVSNNKKALFWRTIPLQDSCFGVLSFLTGKCAPLKDDLVLIFLSLTIMLKKWEKTSKKHAHFCENKLSDVLLWKAWWTVILGCERIVELLQGKMME